MHVKQELVNVNVQMLCCVLPGVWIWVFYRIEKLRLGIVMLILTSLGFGILGATANLANELAFIPVALIPQIVVAVWFARKWSKQWNEKFS